MRKGKMLLALAAALLIPAAMASASVIISAPSADLPAGTTGVVQLNVTITGGDLLQGVNFYVQIADGGADLGGTATHPPTPSLMDASLIAAGTIFGPNNTLEPAKTLLPFVDISSTTTASGTVAANGNLAILSVDVTGAVPGVKYPIVLGNPAFQNTEVLGTAAIGQQLVAGYVQVLVPEPATMILLGLGGLFLRRRTA